MTRRDFLANVYRAGGIAALVALGIKKLEIDSFANGGTWPSPGSRIPPAGGSTYLIEGNFENSLANTGSVGGNFTESIASGAVSNEAYSPALAGSYSLQLYARNDNAGVYVQSPSFTCVSGTCYFYLIFDQETSWNNYAATILTIQDSSNTNLLRIIPNSTSSWAMYHGTTQAEYYTVPPALGTTYHIWGDYTPGSGDGVAHLFVATTATKPAATITITNGNGTGVPDHARLQANYNSTGGFTLFEKLRISNADIGSNPQ